MDAFRNKPVNLFAEATASSVINVNVSRLIPGEDRKADSYPTPSHGLAETFAAQIVSQESTLVRFT